MARPTKITPTVVQKLEEAFALGCSDEEACIYADICKQTLYNFQEKNKEFLDRKELLKNTPILQARKSIIDSFKGNPHIAFKYLERRKSDEFKPLLSRGLSTTGISINFDESFKEKADEAINQYLNVSHNQTYKS